MTRWTPRGVWLLTALAVAGMAREAAAKVVFTGYADFRATPQADSKVVASDASLLTVTPNPVDRRSESRTFLMDSIGLFATTTFDEHTDFLMDVTYRNLTNNTAETRLQYAYLHHHPHWGELKAGRVTLPIGLYNETRFYPFQRYAITPPAFQSAVLGLPIVDQGLVGIKEFGTGKWVLHTAAYVVNGYAASSASTSTFRPGASTTGGLVIANNLRSSNNNSAFAYGGNLGLYVSDDFPGRIKLGASSYNGAWDPTGKKDFSILNGYLALDAGRLNLLAEWIRTDVEEDAGVRRLFNSMDWMSEGAFLEASFALVKEKERELVLFAGTEETMIRGKDAGASGRERFVYHKAGVAWRLNPFVLLKSELTHLDYRLPTHDAGGALLDGILLTRRGIQFSATLTY
jgi:hypothetical protein